MMTVGDNARGKTYTVGGFAKLTNVTERTLRYYDRTGLLKPSARNKQGHRIYNDNDLLRLQQILTLKYLDFSLEDIAAHLENNSGNLLESLEAQARLLEQKRRQLDRVLATMERMRSILHGAGNIDKTLLLLFIHNIQHEGEQREAMARYLPEELVQTVFMEHLTEEDKLEMERKLSLVLMELSTMYNEGKSPDDPEVLKTGEKMMELLQGVFQVDFRTLKDAQHAEGLELLVDPALDQDPVLAQVRLPEGYELFLSKIVELLQASGVEKEGSESDGN